MPRKSTKKVQPEIERPQTFVEWHNQNYEQIGKVHDIEGDKDFSIPPKSDIYFHRTELPKAGDLLVIDCGTKEKPMWNFLRYSARPQLATIDGKRAKGFEPFPPVRGVVKYIIQPTQTNTQ